jgi:hypothetical protein
MVHVDAVGLRLRRSAGSHAGGSKRTERRKPAGNEPAPTERRDRCATGATAEPPASSLAHDYPPLNFLVETCGDVMPFPPSPRRQGGAI